MEYIKLSHNNSEFKRYHKISVYVPILVEDWQSLFLANPDELLANSPVLSKLVQSLTDSIIGRIGDYDCLYHLNLRREGYRALEGATPSYTIPSSDLTVPCVVFTTYAPVDMLEEELFAWLSFVKEIHPWEHPIVIKEQVEMILK